MAVYKENGVWHIYFRYKDILGKTHTIHRQSKKWKLKKDAAKVEQQLKLELNRNYDDLTYEQLFNLYIDERKGKIKERSIYDMTKTSDKHILPYFNRISDIVPKDIKSWQKHLMSLNYSNRHLAKIQQLFKTVLTFGMKHEYITYNPFKIDIARKQEETIKEMLWWEQDDFNKFIQVVDNQHDRLLFELLYWGGLRLGEALALQVSDINFLNGSVSISKTYNHVQHIITSPKTMNSYRKVLLNDSVLVSFRKVIDEYRKTIGYSDEAFIFGYDTPFHPNSLRKRYNRYIQLSGVKRIRLHDFRHSNVSLLRDIGFDRYEIAKRLGHTPEMVDNTYSHWFDSSQQKMVDKLNEFEKMSESATNLQPQENKH